MNFRRKKPRIKARSNVTSMSSWPAWFDIVFHIRPRRRKDRRIEHAVMRGADADEVNWSVSKQPQKYYW